MYKNVFVLFFIVGFTTDLFSQNQLLTVAEQSHFESTSTHAEVLAYIDALKKLSPHIKTEIIATTTEGREIPLLILGNPLPQGPEDLVNDKRVVIYIQGNIHAGEVEGKEAALMLARDLLTSKDQSLWKDVVLLICPNLNADGNDRISTENRPYQPGPKNGVGVRHNASYLDLNRDAIKLESPEMRGVVQHVLNRWDPEISIDLHTTNGVYRQEPTTFSWMNNPNGDIHLMQYVRDRMAPKLQQTLQEKYHTENCYFGEFEMLNDSTEVYMSYAHEPRYLINYIGLRNRIAILNENYVYADYQTRVKACYALLQSLLDYTVGHREEIKKIIQEADLRQSRSWQSDLLPNAFTYDYHVVPIPYPIEIKTYETETYTDEQGRKRMRPTSIKKTLTLPYYADYVADSSFVIPYAYLLPISDQQVIKTLEAHGITIEKLTEDISLEVERFEVQNLKGATRLNQGHYTQMIEGKYLRENRLFKKDTYVVKTAQPLEKVLVYLLEPQTGEGFVFWNFWDKYLVPQWGNGYMNFPVFRLNKAMDLPIKNIR
jgi:hypothetical protein